MELNTEETRETRLRTLIHAGKGGREGGRREGCEKEWCLPRTRADTRGRGQGKEELVFLARTDCAPDADEQRIGK